MSTPTPARARSALEHVTALAGFPPPDPVDVEDFLRGALESEEGEGALALDAFVLPAVPGLDGAGEAYYEVSARFEGEGRALRVYADYSADPADPFADSRTEGTVVAWTASNDLLRRAYDALERGPLAAFAGDESGLLRAVGGTGPRPTSMPLPVRALARLAGAYDLSEEEGLLAARVAEELADGVPLGWALRRGAVPEG